MSIALQADSVNPQGYILINGTAAATVRQDGSLIIPSLSASGIRVTSTIIGNLSGNVTGNIVGSLSGIASQATTLTTASAGAAPVYGCRAWVNFDGSRNASGGSDTALTNRFIRSAGNVSSVLRVSQGGYTINFTVPMADINYSAVSNAYLAGTAVNSNQTYNYATSSVTVGIWNGAGTAIDPTNVSIQIFGN